MAGVLVPGGDLETAADLDRWDRFWGWDAATTHGELSGPGEAVTMFDPGTAADWVVWLGPEVDVTAGDVIDVAVEVESNGAGAAARLQLLAGPGRPVNYFAPGSRIVRDVASGPLVDYASRTLRARWTVPRDVGTVRVALRIERGTAPLPVYVWQRAWADTLNGTPDGTESAQLRFRVGGSPRTCDTLAGVRVSWGRTHPAESLEPRRVVATLEEVEVRRGQTLTVDVVDQAAEVTWATAQGSWETYAGSWLGARVELRIFTGTVSDTATSWRAVNEPARLHEVLSDVVGLDPMADLSSLPAGETAYPAESAHDRAARIAALTGHAWDLDAATSRVAARDPQTAGALELLDDLASWVSVSGGVWFDPVTNRAAWLTDQSRGSIVPDLILDACEFDESARLVEDPADLVNVYTVGYVDAAGKRLEVTSTDPASIIDNGHRSGQRSTELVDPDDARDLAATMTARYGTVSSKWQGVRVKLGDLDKPRRTKLLALGPRTRVRLERLPEPAAHQWSGYVEGWALELDGPDVADWVVDLTLSPARWSGRLLPWADVPTSKTWADAVGAWQDTDDTL